MLQKQKVVETLSKWNILESVQSLKLEELEKLRRKQSSKSSDSGRDRDRDSGDGGRVGSEEGFMRMERNRGLNAVRKVLFTVAITALSAHSLLAAVKANKENKIDFKRIFDKISATDCTTILNKVLQYGKEIHGFGGISVFLCGLFSQISFIFQEMYDHLVDAGMPNVSFPNIFSFPKPSKLNVLASTVQVMTAELGYQVQQILLFIGVALGPFLLWYRSLSSSSSALYAVGDIVAVGNALDNPAFDSFFPQLQDPDR
jgi:hypothetical protein